MDEVKEKEFNPGAAFPPEEQNASTQDGINATTAQISLSYDRLKAFLKVIEVINDEAKIIIDKSGMETKSVDPAHVFMVTVRIDKTMFESLTINDGEQITFGWDISDTLKTLKSIKPEFVVLTILLKDKKIKYSCKVGDYTYLISQKIVDYSNMAEVKVPKLDLPYKFDMDSKVLQNFINTISRKRDYIRMEGTTTGLHLSNYSRKETDENKIEVFIPDGSGLNLHLKTEIKSIYSTDFMSKILKGCFTRNIKIQINNDYPIIIESKTTGMNAMYLLAPRIESA